MELHRCADGTVTPLAVVRALQGITIDTLAKRVQEDPCVVFSWETGATEIPSDAAAKRLALALGWRWRDLLVEPLPYEEAWQTLLDGRQRIAASR
jgi:ribosome-binding protein aMBF1 (putative translation factor)